MMMMMMMMIIGPRVIEQCAAVANWQAQKSKLLVVSVYN